MHRALRHTLHDTPAYYKKLKELDGYVGQMIEAVKEAGMLDETIFIVTTDHGGIIIEISSIQ